MSFTQAMYTGAQLRALWDDQEKKKRIEQGIAEVANANPEAVDVEQQGPTQDGSALPPVQVQKFLGQTFTEAPTDGQKLSARQVAMAGVYEKNGDAEGAMKYRHQAQQGELTDYQLSQAKRQGAREDKADAHTAVLERVDKDVADWDTKRRTLPDGTMRDMTPDDQLETGQYRASKLVQAGKLAEANALAKDNMNFAANKIQLQTVERNEALGQTAAAIAAGDLSKVAPFYEKYIPDGAKITGVTTDKDGKISIERETLDGRKVPPVVFKDKDQLLAGLNTFKDPMSLYNYSQSEFHHLMQVNQDKRADKSVAIQASTAAASNRLHNLQADDVQEKVNDRKELGTIRQSLNDAIETGDTAGEATARKQLLTYGLSGKGAQNMSDTERKANFFLASGAAKTPEEAAKMAHEKVQSSPKDDYLKLTTSAMPLQGEQLENAMQTLHGKGWKSKVQGETTPSPAMTFGSQADAEAAVKAGKLKKGDRVIINGRAATYQ